jgi:hypothetical protein
MRFKTAASAIVAVSLAGCGTGIGSPSATVEEGTLATPTLGPSPTLTEVSPSPSGNSMPRTELGPDAVARVVTNDLVARSLPEISDRSTIDPIRLQDGQYLYVLEGPVRADGYTWYRAVPFQRCCTDIAESMPLLGWVAAGGKDGEAWIALAADECGDLAGNFYAMLDLLGLACLGNREMVFEGIVTGCSGIVKGNIEPVWLAEHNCGLQPEGFVPGELGPANLPFHVRDGLALPGERDAPIRIVGHMDDPAAATCRVVREVSAEPEPPEIVVLNCRRAFVATEIARLDPS